MQINICDRCGMQIDRFADKDYNVSIRVDISREKLVDYGMGPDREERKKNHDPKAFYTRWLSFCPECNKKMTDLVMNELGKLPEKITANTRIIEEQY